MDGSFLMWPRCSGTPNVKAIHVDGSQPTVPGICVVTDIRRMCSHQHPGLSPLPLPPRLPAAPPPRWLVMCEDYLLASCLVQFECVVTLVLFSFECASMISLFRTWLRLAGDDDGARTLYHILYILACDTQRFA